MGWYSLDACHLTFQVQPRAPNPGTIEITALIVNPGSGFNIIGNKFAPIQNVAHTAKIELDNQQLGAVVSTNVNAGGFFNLQNVAVPTGTKSGEHTLKVTILPENLS